MTGFISLNGEWDVGEERRYLGRCTVPGLQRDPSASQQGKLWLKREVILPDCPFSRCSLLLKGARFHPALYVNGDFIAESEGGMAPVRFVFSHPDCRPGQKIQIEICLLSLTDLPGEDASRIPEADHWRSNISSCLWDDVELSLVGNTVITELVPFVSNDGVSLTARIKLDSSADCDLGLKLCSCDGIVLARAQKKTGLAQEEMTLTFPEIFYWSTAHPDLYSLIAEAETPEGCSVMTCSVARRSFSVRDKHFFSNGHRERLRGTSIVWHRFCRDPEGRTLAFNREWFVNNVFLPCKKAGINYLRFHLGLPPEWMLDIADEMGFWVQIEWHFFHGIRAGAESLRMQWREAFALAARHPCVCIFQPWNETEGDVLQKATCIANELRTDFPPLLISHLDILHLHKYWWSLFENLSLSYDSYEDFSLPAVADEFGGNYLDGEGNPGLYPDASEAFIRFLGPCSTKEERLELQALSNARVAEYWRRLDVAGYATFCLLSSPEDGSHHFLGKLPDGKFKPVWAACSAAFAPDAACPEIWNRAGFLGQILELPVHFYHDGADETELEARCEIIDEWENSADSHRFRCTVPGGSHQVKRVEVHLPESGTFCTLRTGLGDTGPVSEWKIRLYPKELPKSGVRAKVLVLDRDQELTEYVRRLGMTLTGSLSGCDLILGGQSALNRIHEDAETRQKVEAALTRGAALALLQIGPQSLGEGYMQDKRTVCADGLTASVPAVVSYRLPLGLELGFEHLPEAESCCHRGENADVCWKGLHRQALQLSNGYRGGLNVPAEEMTVSSINRETFRQLWNSRGISEEQLSCPYSFVYELCGFYAWAECDSASVKNSLRGKVRRLVEDAPSLAVSMNTEDAIRVHPVGAQYRCLPERQGEIHSLVRCGRRQSRSPVQLIQIGKARILLSQLLTAGRLLEENQTQERYGVCYDPEMARLVQNMLLSLHPDPGSLEINE